MCVWGNRKLLMTSPMATRGKWTLRDERCQYKVCRPKPTLCTTCIHLEALGASKCVHVAHSVGFRMVLALGRHTLIVRRARVC